MKVARRNPLQRRHSHVSSLNLYKVENLVFESRKIVQKLLDEAVEKKVNNKGGTDFVHIEVKDPPTYRVIETEIAHTVRALVSGTKKLRSGTVQEGGCSAKERV